MIKEAVKYQANKFGKVMMIYYATMLVLLIASMNIINTIAAGGVITVTGTENITSLVIFIWAISSFEENFKMFIQNGISRKTVFYSYLITITGMASIMALINTIYTVILKLYFEHDSAFSSIRYMGSNSILQFIDGFLWIILSYITAAMLGYFITIFYYRMSKKLRISVLVGVPGLLVIILMSARNNRMSVAILEKMATFIAGIIDTINGYNDYLVAIVYIIILGVLIYNLLRKAIVKIS